MSAPLMPLAALSALAALLYLLADCLRLGPAARSASKTAAIGALAAIAAGTGPLWLTLALALSAVGDLLLSRPGDRAFLLGMAAFLAAHLAYLALFLDRPATGWPPGPVALVLGPLAAGLLVWLWPGLGAFRLPVLVYAAAILAMGLAALSRGAPPVRLAAVLFILSDAVLAAERFRLPARSPLRRITAPLIWTTYYAAQALFLAALAGGAAPGP